METLPSYTLSEPVFPLRALAVATSRAPLGGVREALMATLVAARLASASRGPDALPASLRAQRTTAARHWMGALTLPGPLRSAIGQLLDTSARDDAPAVAAALANVTEITAPYLDRKARAELDRLARSLGA